MLVRGEGTIVQGAIIHSMSDGKEEQWSPARHPYAIAVSQSWWALQAAVLFADDAKNGSGAAQQIYARQIFGQLRALRRCAEMQARELRRLAVDAVDRDRLDREIEQFDAAVPASKHGRDILEHFDEYARGQGKLQQRDICGRGHDLFEVAATYWGGGYDPSTEELTQGPFVIVVPDALEAAQRLHRAIYAAGLAVDRLGPRRASSPH